MSSLKQICDGGVIVPILQMWTLEEDAVTCPRSDRKYPMWARVRAQGFQISSPVLFPG